MARPLARKQKTFRELACPTAAYLSSSLSAGSPIVHTCDGRGFVERAVLVVHSMDRLARNLDDLRKIVLGLTSRGVIVEFEKERLTFTGEDNAMSNLLLNVMGAFAEFERSLIKERQREGIALAKRKGVCKGRKPSLTVEKVAELLKRAQAGEKKAALAREFGISRETLYSYLAQQTV
jgi:DNA invertase Pin-like site-specific DNA recombinase